MTIWFNSLYDKSGDNLINMGLEDFTFIRSILSISHLIFGLIFGQDKFKTIAEQE